MLARIAALVLCIALANPAQAQDQQPVFKMPDAGSTVKSFSYRLKTDTPQDCKQRCNSPSGTDDKIYCCVTCLGVQYICGITGSCYCEVPLRLRFSLGSSSTTNKPGGMCGGMTCPDGTPAFDDPGGCLCFIK